MPHDIVFEDPGFDFSDPNYRHEKASLVEMLRKLLSAEQQGSRREAVMDPSKRVLGFVDFSQNVVTLTGFANIRGVGGIFPEDLGDRFGSWDAVIGHMVDSERRRVLFEDPNAFDFELRSTPRVINRDVDYQGLGAYGTPEQIESIRRSMEIEGVTPKTFKVTEGHISGDDLLRGTLPSIEDHPRIVGTAFRMDDKSVVIVNS